VKEYFSSSIKDDYELVLKEDDHTGPSVSYKQKGWCEITRSKVVCIIDAIQGNWNKCFVFSDPDIQFFGKTKSHLLRAIKNKDIVLQRDSPGGMICTGFFICRGNGKTFKLWQDVSDLILEGGG